MDKEIIIKAIMITAMVSVGITALSVIVPNFFLGMGRVLSASLLIFIIAEFISLIFFHTIPTIMEFIGCAIFSGYIGFDIAVSQEMEPTLDNAVDRATSLYLDIINLFVKILRIVAKAKK